MSLRVAGKGYKATDRILSGLMKKIDEKQKVLHMVGEEVSSEAKSNLQNKGHILTGELHAHVGILAEGPNYVRVGTTKKQGAIIERGRGEVRPKKPGGRLRWVDKHSGEVVYATKSGPVKPDPWLEPAVIVKRKRYRDLMAEETHRIVIENKGAG